MPIGNLLDKLFVYVPSASVKNFKTNHIGSNKENDDFYNKICFLGGTGEIVVHAERFAVNSAGDITRLETLLGSSLPSGISATTVIGFINDVYTLAQANQTVIGDNNSGLIKDVNTLKSEVETTTTGLLDRTTAVEGKVSTLVSTDTSKSVREIAAEETAKIVANADSSYDTLKEIADWILSDTTGAAKMANDISELKDKVGNSSVSSQITAAIEALDVTASTESADGTPQHNGTFVVSGVTLGETDGKISGFAVTSTEVEAAGAAAAVQSALLGTAADANNGTAYTIHGVQNYAKQLVDNKNVGANSSYTSLITASASGNTVTVGVTDALKSAIDKANSAIQSIQYTTTNASYITVAGAVDTVTAGDVTLTVTPVIGTLSISNNTATYTSGIASTEAVASLLNSINVWEEYTSNAS